MNPWQDVQVKCIREWHSEVHPEINYGVLGEKYRIVSQLPFLTDKPKYLSLEGLDPYPGGWGWVNAERFERVDKVLA